MNPLNLFSFIPFRLNRLADEVSKELSVVYAERFGVDIVEWRILVTLACSGPCTAQSIVNSTRTHKSRISRGVKRLIEARLIVGETHIDDARSVELLLTGEGKALYDNMVPSILEKEQRIMECLSDSERAAFESALSKLENALNLQRKI
ncbi:MAG: MarR family winged helix-turn-helix transcriptional regulator [Granulosicoccus sp.]